MGVRTDWGREVEKVRRRLEAERVVKVGSGREEEEEEEV